MFEISDLEGLSDLEKVQKIAEKDPIIFLYNIKFFKYTPNLNLSELLSKIAEEEPESFLYNIQYLKDIPNFNLSEKLIIAAEKEPVTFIFNIEFFKDIPNLNLSELLSKIAEKDPKVFLSCAQLLNNIPNFNLAEKLIIAAEKEPVSFLKNIEDIKNIPDLNISELVSKAAEKEPILFMSNIKEISSAIDEANLIELISNNIKNLKGIENLEQSKIIPSNIDYNLYSAIFINKIINNTLSEKDVIKIINDENEYFKALLEIKSIPNHIGDNGIEGGLRAVCLDKVFKINQLHLSPDNIRFQSIEKLNSKEVYSLMVYGEQEIYTSSFNGCFNRLLTKMDTEKIDGQELFDQVGNNKFRTFVKECTWFNKLEQFLNKMDKNDADKLLKDVVKNIESTNNKLDQAITIADILGSINDPETLKVLQKQIKTEYERINNTPNVNLEDKAIYGLLAGMFSNNAVIEQEWFKQIYNEYPINKVTGIESKELFDENGICTQKYHFYEGGDEDGIRSFNNFMSKYESDSKWKVDKTHGNYVIITAKNKDKTIEIYANDPRTGDSGKIGLNEMDGALKDKKIIIYSYRGHSTDVSLDGISKDTKITNIGSCGGYNRLSEVLDLSPDTQVISTKGTGSMYVNDPIFKDLNDKILKGEDINWKIFWKEQEKKLGSNEKFKDYVSPDENQGLMFMKAYNDSIH
jgi:hypothetical protein